MKLGLEIARWPVPPVTWLTVLLCLPRVTLSTALLKKAEPLLLRTRSTVTSGHPFTVLLPNFLFYYQGTWGPFLSKQRFRKPVDLHLYICNNIVSLVSSRQRWGTEVEKIGSTWKSTQRPHILPPPPDSLPRRLLIVVLVSLLNLKLTFSNWRNTQEGTTTKTNQIRGISRLYKNRTNAHMSLRVVRIRSGKKFSNWKYKQ